MKKTLRRFFVKGISSTVVASILLSGMTVGQWAYADTICTPTVSSPSSLGITNFSFGAINNTTVTPSGQGGVAYKDYTSSFSPVLLTRGTSNNSYSLSFSPSNKYFTLFTWIDNNTFDGAAQSGTLIASPISSTFVVQDSYPAGLGVLRVGVSSTQISLSSICSLNDGEYEDYPILIQGATPDVVTYLSNYNNFVSESGRTDVVEIQLDKAPTQNVTVTLSPSSRVSLSSTTLTFTPSNWYVKQPVTISAVNDALSNGNTDEQITFSVSSSDSGYNNLAVDPITVQVIDNEASDDASVEIHIFSTSTANNSGPDYAKVSGIAPFGEFTGDNFFGPTDSSDVTSPIARRYNFSSSVATPLSLDITPELTTLSSPTTLSLGDDEVSTDISLPFDVMMYGRAMKHIGIVSNGAVYISPRAIQMTDPLNSLPYDGVSALDLTDMNAHDIDFTATTTNMSDEMLVAALWSDLTPASAGGGGTISYGVEGTAPNRTFVVYFNDVAPYDASGAGNTVQVKFRETAVGPSNDVMVTASVEPLVSFSLSSSNCSLGNLTSSSVGSCSYDITTATNATNGLIVQIEGDSAELVSGLNNIDACASSGCAGGVNAGTEEYGFYVSSVGGDHDATGYSADSEPVPTSATTIITASAPHLSTTSTVTHKASVSDTTPAGSYLHTVTLTAVGSF